jgi:hypothetical protein
VVQERATGYIVIESHIAQSARGLLSKPRKKREYLAAVDSTAIAVLNAARADARKKNGFDPSLIDSILESCDSPG